VPRDVGLYLEDMVEAVRRIRSYVTGANEAAFKTDQRSIDAVVHNLTIMGEAAKGIPQHLRDLAPDIDWRKIAGMRDLLVHSYFSIDLAIVWDAACNKVPGLEASLRRLLGSLERH
jgi:uncharacterized protein with HEPN domain